MASQNDERPIEEKFSASWDEIEPWYKLLCDLPNWQWMKPILGLIAELRSRGNDQQFRAGQQLATFILSRSQKHGLRLEQPRLSIDLNPEGGMTLRYKEPPNPVIKVNLERVELAPELEQFLSRLLMHPID